MHPPRREGDGAQAVPESRPAQNIAPNGCSRSSVLSLNRFPRGICVIRRTNSIRRVAEIRIQDTLSGETRTLEPRESREDGIYPCRPTGDGRTPIAPATPRV